MSKLLAIEGGWGAGKTTLLEGVKDSFQVLPSIVPQIYDILGRGNDKTPDKDPESFSELFYLLRSKELIDLSIKEGPPILCDRTLFAPIVLRKFNDLPVSEKFYNTINELRNKGFLHNKVFFVEQIPFKKFDKGWPKRKFNFEEADRYSRITENLIKQMNFEIIRILIATKQERIETFKVSVKNELESILITDNKSNIIL